MSQGRRNAMKECLRILTTLILFIGCSGFPQTLSADVALIVHPSHQLDTINVDQASSIFLGKTRTLSDGTEVLPIDQDVAEVPRAEFHKCITGKDEYMYKAYWFRMIFTGKGQPPEAVANDDEMLELISTDPGFIGYVDTDSLPKDGSVKVLLRVP
jgi:hypothetical protein